MKKIIHIIVYEYKRHVFRKRFLISLMSVPTLLAIMGLVIIILVQLESRVIPVGYIDYSGLLSNTLSDAVLESLKGGPLLVHFQSETQATRALQSGDIQAYFVLEPDYIKTSKARLVALDGVQDSVEGKFNNFVRAHLMHEQPSQVLQRINEGNRFILQPIEERQPSDERDWSRILVPFLVGFIFMMAVFITSGYLMQAVVEEKEQRTAEVLITSVSHSQLMSGKIIGLISVGVTQLIIWVGLVGIVIFLASISLGGIISMRINIELIGLLLATLLPAFVMIAALITAIGALVTNTREGQQFTAIVTIPIVIPYWFISQFMNNPNGTIPILLSYFPLTAPVALSMRAAFTEIPTWQFVLNVITLLLFAGIALWLAGRAFRLGMLQYRSPLSFNKLLRRSD